MLSTSSGKLSLSDAFSSSRAPWKVITNVSDHLETQAVHNLSCFHLYMKQCHMAMYKYSSVSSVLQVTECIGKLSEFVHTLQ